jgi:predicted nucleic acid-binding protein
MVLVDTSVWIQHFKKPDLKLVALLENTKVVTHSFVLGELYLGRPKNKSLIFEQLHLLPILQNIEYPEISDFINQYNLNQKGVGYIDVSLLASAYKYDAGLYTLDKKLSALAEKIL